MRRRIKVLAVLSVVGFALLPVTLAGGAETFGDGFESGDFSAWTAVDRGGDGTAVVQSDLKHGGTFAARLTASTSTTSFARARKTLSAPQADVTAAGWFNLQAEGVSNANVPLLRLYGSDDARTVSVYRQNLSSDAVWVQHSGAYHKTSGKIPLKTWAYVETTLTAAGTSDAVIEVRINGTSVYRASGTLAPVLTVQIGNDTKGQAFSIVVDDVTIEGGSASQPPPPPPSGDPVLVGAGDIADCNNPGDDATAALLDEIPGTVFTTGDNVYPTGTLAQYNSCYAPSWGRHKDRTRPAPGNHEYDAEGKTGYFDYFGATAGDPKKGYYSYDLGNWHVIVLNSNCSIVGGCQAGSLQEQWLRADLAANPADCTVAVMHHPRFSSGTKHGSSAAMQPFWQALYEAGAELVLAGHEHSYERFAPMTATGDADSSFGLRSFVVGSGGFSHYPLGTPLPNSEARNSDTFGVLKLTLRDGSYEWQFVPEKGKTYTDTGTGECHGAPSSPPPPDGFTDGFESGDFSAWTSQLTGADGSAVVQQALVKEGTRAARLEATATAGSYAYARTSFSPLAEMSASGWFNLQAEGPAGANVPLLRMFDGSGKRIVSLYRQNQSADRLWVNHSGSYLSTTGKLPLGTWARLTLRVTVAGTTSTVEAYLNDVRIYQTGAADLGTSGVASVQIGNNTAGQPFDLVVDDVSTGSSAG